MRKVSNLLIVVMLLLNAGIILLAQPNPPHPIVFVTTAPSGSCAVGTTSYNFYVVVSTGAIWVCEGTAVGATGTWTAVAFSTLGVPLVSSSGVASMSAVSAAINTTETSLVSYQVPANFASAGATFRIKVYGTCTSTVANASNLYVRWGSANSSADTAIMTITPTAATSGTNVPFVAEFLITFQSTTVAEGVGSLFNSGVTGVSAAAVVVGAPVNTTGLTTTSAEYIHLSYLSAATTTTATFQGATIEIVNP